MRRYRSGNENKEQRGDHESQLKAVECPADRVEAGKQQQLLPISARVKSTVLLFVRSSDAMKKPDFNRHLFSLSRR